ncbi:hypothetical protein [Jiangella sp. DSM 45060]|uniref:hypothetical protein n=1 Tax=Jiangella sp. DSM 45060 TaxID=1798224 RepID=UPI00087C0CBB|nr:hypothetical protein [Jiangella sp. DSM 45060]SDT69566.1 hypothetical protein SAMN04515669_6040 [Jiangella sp. DSM 45060]
MDLSLFIAFAAAVIALGAAIFTGLQWSESRRSANQATRSADEAARAADAADRSAAAAEGSLELQRRAADQERVVWEFTQISGQGRYALRNDGTDAALNVRIEPHATVFEGETQYDEFAAGQEEAYHAEEYGNEGYIIVRWHQEGDAADSRPRAKKLHL